jgi:hypothetical protein
MFSAKAVARTRDATTFARAALDGPVLRKTKKTDPKRKTHARGNGV